MSLITHSEAIPEASSALMSLILTDEYGAPLQVSLTTLLLTYYDKATEAVINSREDQDVLNTNNVTFGLESQGTPTCTFTAATKTIRRATGNWLNTGVVVGSQILLSGTVSNNAVFTVTRVTALDLTVSETVTTEAAVVTTVGLPGKILWTMQPADTVIVDARKELEDHIALFVWTWSGGTKSGAQEVQVSIENLSLHP